MVRRRRVVAGNLRLEGTLRGSYSRAFGPVDSGLANFRLQGALRAPCSLRNAATDHRLSATWRASSGPVGG